MCFVLFLSFTAFPWSYCYLWRGLFFLTLLLFHLNLSLFHTVHIFRLISFNCSCSSLLFIAFSPPCGSRYLHCVLCLSPYTPWTPCPSPWSWSPSPPVGLPVSILLGCPALYPLGSNLLHCLSFCCFFLCACFCSASPSTNICYISNMFNEGHSYH